MNENERKVLINKKKTWQKMNESERKVDLLDNFNY